MEIKKTIEKFLSFVLDEKSELDDLGELISALDQLAIMVNQINYKFDDREYPDAPEKDFKTIREKRRSIQL